MLNALSLDVGGGRSYVLNLLRELGRDSRGFDFTLLVAPGRLTPKQARGIRVETVPLPTAASRSRTILRVLYEELLLPLRARRFDLLYCLADISPPFGSAPTVVLMRNLNIYDRSYYDTPRLRTLELLARLGMRRARRLVFPSCAAADLISKKMSIPRERCRIVPYGIAPEAFTDDLAPRRSEAPYLFLPAALERHKNIGVLIRSLGYVDDPSLEIRIAGGEQTDPGYAAELRDLAREVGVAGRVRFIGRVSYDEILSYYRGAVALVFPSLLETFGHPLLEAMLAETPIVAADIASFREIAADTAIYFPPDDPQQLARTIEQVRSQPEATRTRVAAGRKRAAEFSWKRSMDRLCGVFAEVLSES